MDWRCLERLVEAYYAGGISRRDFARGALAFGVAVAALPSAVTEILTRPAGAQPLKGSGEPEEGILRPVRSGNRHPRPGRGNA